MANYHPTLLIDFILRVYAIASPSVCLSSVTFLHPTQELNQSINHLFIS